MADEQPQIIRSRNELFRGEEFPKPRRALVVGHDPEKGDIYQCPACGHQTDVEFCDVVGSEPGCLFCPNCQTEFEAWDE